jgi:hypothetical protein
MHQIDNRKEKKPFSVPSSPDKLICYLEQTKKKFFSGSHKFTELHSHQVMNIEQSLSIEAHRQAPSGCYRLATAFLSLSRHRTQQT